MSQAARTTTVVVIGGGHSGLAMSRRLTERGVDHVVLERGEPGHSWRTQRWDSLRLLTPTWMTRLPGLDPATPVLADADPDGYLHAREVAALLEAYADGVPLRPHTTVTAVHPGGGAHGGTEGGFVFETDDGPWHAQAVVLAAGTTTAPLPPVAAALPDTVVSLTALDYRSPDQLPDGGVLVVGAGASGVQLAAEIHASGRPVTLSTGEHVRAPRRYRDRDLLFWLDAIGILDHRWDEVDDVVRARHLPSFQLAAGADDIDLAALQARGVQVVGRLGGVRDGVAQFSGALANVITLADLKLDRLLTAIDDAVGGRGERPDRTPIPDAPLLVPLERAGIRTVVWTTGIKPDYSWLDLPVLDHKGLPRHDGGVVDWPGLYVVGLPVLRRRRSTFIDGAAADTADLAEHLLGHLAARTTA